MLAAVATVAVGRIFLAGATQLDRGPWMTEVPRPAVKVDDSAAAISPPSGTWPLSQSQPGPDDAAPEFYAIAWSTTCFCECFGVTTDGCSAWQSKGNRTGAGWSCAVSNRSNYACKNYSNIVPVAGGMPSHHTLPGGKSHVFGTFANLSVPCVLYGNAVLGAAGRGMCSGGAGLGSSVTGPAAFPGVSALPPGRRTITLEADSLLEELVPEVGGSVGPSADNIMPVTQSGCTGKDNTSFTGLWWPHSMATIAEQSDLFFAELHRQGGAVDEIMLDWEQEMTTFFIHSQTARPCPGPPNSSAADACLRCAREKFNAIESDPRWEAALGELRALGFRLDQGQGLADSMVPLIPFEKSASVVTPGQDKRIAVWNAYVRNRATTYWKTAVEDTARKYFPHVVLTMYGYSRWSSDQCFVTTEAGVLPCVAGGDATSLSIQSPVLYDEWEAFDCISPPASCGHLPACPDMKSFCASEPGISKALRHFWGVPEYNFTMFHAMKFQANVVRSHVLAAPTVPVAPWINFRSFQYYMRSPTGYWQEKIIHAGLLGASKFYYYNVWAERGYGQRTTADDDAVFSATLGALEAAVGSPNRRWVIDESPRWEDAFQLTGMDVDGTRVWRLTPAGLPKAPALTTAVDAATGELNVSSVGFAAGQTLLSCSLLFSNGRVRKNAAETPFGLWIVQASRGLASSANHSVLLSCEDGRRFAWPRPRERRSTIKTDDEPEFANSDTALEMLRALPALPVVHYSWPFCSEPYWCTRDFMGSALPWSDPDVMREYARITHSVSTFASLSVAGWVDLPQATSDIMWEKLVAGVAHTDASIAIQLITAHRGSPQLPTSADMLAQLHDATRSLKRANLKLGANASIGAVLIDEESHGRNMSNPSEITQFNDRVYNVTSSVFGRDVDIQYYGRGLSAVSDEHSDGWWDTAWYTLSEIDNRQLSTSLYTVPERSTMRIQYQRTLEKMHNESTRCEADNTRRAAAGLPTRWCPDRVVPWISLGAGNRPSDNLTQGTGYEYGLPWDYPRWYSWELGRDINNATARTPTTNFFDFAKNVVFYPSAFDKHSPQLGRSDLTVMLLHFVAYCRGAAGIKELPTLGVGLKTSDDEALMVRDPTRKDVKIASAGSATTVQPFAFRLRGVPSTTVAVTEGPLQQPLQFAWAIVQLGRTMHPVSAAAGEWSNWTDFTAADAKLAASHPHQSASLERLILTVRMTWKPPPAEFATAHVQIEFTRGTAVATGPAVKQVAATLGFRPLALGSVPGANVGLMVAPGSALGFETYREFNNRTFFRAFPPAPVKRPRLFPLMDRLIGDDDIDGERQGVDALGRLGYTGLQSGYANGPSTKAVFMKAGIQWTNVAGHIENFAFAASECRGSCRESNITVDAHRWFAAGRAAGFGSSDFKLAKIADEPGWYFPSTWVAAANSSAATDRWHSLLRDTAGLTPAELLVNATTWREISFAGRSVANGSLQDRRRFYWTNRFFSLDSSEYYANATRTFEAALGEDGCAFFANWNNFASRMYVPGPVGHNQARGDPDAAMASHDWSDFGRARGGTVLWTEDWWAPAAWWSFQGAKMRSSGAPLGLPWGAYVIPRARALETGDMVQRVATIVGSGGKSIIYYNFGPDYAFPGNCWGLGNESLSLAPQIQAAHELLASAEDMLWAGARPSASVAILAPRSAEPWDDLCSMFDDTCSFGKRGNRTRRNMGAFGKCCAAPSNIMDCTNFDQAERTVDYMSEVYGAYHALAQVSNIPTEFVDETTLAKNASRMDTIATLLVSEPNLPSEGATALTEWVQRGGHLILLCAGGVLDEYNEPAPAVWQALGLLAPDVPKTDFAEWAPASRMNVHALGEDVWGPATAFNGSGVSPSGASLTVKAYGRRCLSRAELNGELNVGAGETVLARFTDGSPAISTRNVGNGSVVRFAWLPGVSHLSAMAKSKTAPPDRPEPTQLTEASKWLAATVGLAHTAPEPTAVAVVDAPLVETPILLSDLGAVVTVLDWRPKAPLGDKRGRPDLTLNVTLPFAPTMVQSAQSGALVWTAGAARGNGCHSGTVKIATPSQGADYITFRLKCDDDRLPAGISTSSF